MTSINDKKKLVLDSLSIDLLFEFRRLFGRVRWT